MILKIFFEYLIYSDFMELILLDSSSQAEICFNLQISNHPPTSSHPYTPILARKVVKQLETAQPCIAKSEQVEILPCSTKYSFNQAFTEFEKAAKVHDFCQMKDQLKLTYDTT
jgi:hypothetical protein